jgi:hypothetical protein
VSDISFLLPYFRPCGRASLSLWHVLLVQCFG